MEVIFRYGKICEINIMLNEMERITRDAIMCKKSRNELIKEFVLFAVTSNSKFGFSESITEEELFAEDLKITPVEHLSIQSIEWD